MLRAAPRPDANAEELTWEAVGTALGLPERADRNAVGRCLY